MTLGKLFQVSYSKLFRFLLKSDVMWDIGNKTEDISFVFSVLSFSMHIGGIYNFPPLGQDIKDKHITIYGALRYHNNRGC